MSIGGVTTGVMGRKEKNELPSCFSYVPQYQTARFTYNENWKRCQTKSRIWDILFQNNKHTKGIPCPCSILNSAKPSIFFMSVYLINTISI